MCIVCVHAFQCNLPKCHFSILPQFVYDIICMREYFTVIRASLSPQKKKKEIVLVLVYYVCIAKYHVSNNFTRNISECYFLSAHFSHYLNLRFFFFIRWFVLSSVLHLKGKPLNSHFFLSIFISFFFCSCVQPRIERPYFIPLLFIVLKIYALFFLFECMSLMSFINIKSTRKKKTKDKLFVGIIFIAKNKLF